MGNDKQHWNLIFFQKYLTWFISVKQYGDWRNHVSHNYLILIQLQKTRKIDKFVV